MIEQRGHQLAELRRERRAAEEHYLAARAALDDLLLGANPPRTRPSPPRGPVLTGAVWGALLGLWLALCSVAMDHLK
ncbi:MAG TPA: hypothetical protein VLA79_06935 [Polyangia bacterium]|nr:hypothetical protein [Polyangia bacterium]